MSLQGFCGLPWEFLIFVHAPGDVNSADVTENHSLKGWWTFEGYDAFPDCTNSREGSSFDETDVDSCATEALAEGYRGFSVIRRGAFNACCFKRESSDALLSNSVEDPNSTLYVLSNGNTLVHGSCGRTTRTNLTTTKEVAWHSVSMMPKDITMGLAHLTKSAMDIQQCLTFSKNRGRTTC